MEQIDQINLDETQSLKPPTAFQFMFDSMTKDMKFVGIFTIIYGVLNCLTIIGAIIGVPVIFIGMRIRESADQFSIFRATNNASAMRAGFELQGKYFRIIKILIIVYLILIAVSIIVAIALVGYLMNRLMQFPQT